MLRAEDAAQAERGLQELLAIVTGPERPWRDYAPDAAPPAP